VEDPTEEDLRHFAEQLARMPAVQVVLTLLEPGDEEQLGLGRIRLDPSGYLSDRVTGREVIRRGENKATFKGFAIERPSPDHYRIRTATDETILLRYTHRSWYHRPGA
jgi:hypothetical protein